MAAAAAIEELADQMRQDLGDSARKMKGSGRRPAGKLKEDDPRYVVKEGLQTLVESQQDTLAGRTRRFRCSAITRRSGGALV